MKTLLRPFLLLFLVGVLANYAHAKAWRGIVPFHSSRADVERVFGKPVCDDENGLGYESEKESVYFVLAPAENAVSCATKLPPGTVLRIEITPKAQLRLIDVARDEKTLVLLDTHDIFPLGLSAYVSDEGVVIRIINGVVDTIHFVPEARDRNLCPVYYANPRDLVSEVVCKLCPVIRVMAPEKIERGKVITFIAKVMGVGRCAHLTFSWTTSEGQIVEGQGTRSIKVETKSITDNKMWAAVTIDGLDRSCANKESVVTELTGRP